MGVKDEKFEYCGSSLKNPIFREGEGGGVGFTKKQYIGGGLPKNRGLGTLQI